MCFVSDSGFVQTLKNERLNEFSSRGSSLGLKFSIERLSKFDRAFSIVPNSENKSRKEIKFCAELVRYGVKIK